MQNTTATLYCPNCQAPNPLPSELCQQCQTPLPKRYLWAAGQAIEGHEGDLLEGRYLLKSSRVLLDTQPGWTAENQPSISEAVEPYLRLFPYRLHVPQVYGSVWTKGANPQEVLLLEQAPIGPSDLLETFDPNPSVGAIPLELAWPRASALRQLSWLWQIAQLWQPLSSQGVVSSLLQPELLRVEGPLVRLLELRLDQHSLTLAELGQLWLQWVPNAQTTVAASLQALCQQMIQGQVRTAEQLMSQLEQWLMLVGKLRSYQVEISTRTDQGPSRQQNEDACYPPNGAVVTSRPLTIVCDGVGGHAGGATASTLAIETLKQQLQAVPIESIDPRALLAELENAVCTANDTISQRNDNERRQGRQRMGTTLVMALAKAHEMYITHAGDSRAYWITRAGCYQVTLDDDVASREVRLGYAPYRIALQQPASGSLVQALGMGPSAILHPTVQRFILDEDCVFLLCSDGLSDHDRVEEHWEEILPILDGKIDLATASQRLIAIANTQNGHDNVTVSLIHCQVSEAKDGPPPQLLLAHPSDTSASTQLSQDIGMTSSTPSNLKTQILRPKRSAAGPWFLLSISLLLGLGGLGAYLFIPSLSQQVNAWIGSRDSSTLPVPTSKAEQAKLPRISPTPSSFAPLPSASPLAVGSLVQVTSSTPGPQAQATSVILLRQSGTQAIEGSVLAGSVLQIKERVTLRQQGNWLRVIVCSSPSVPLNSSVSTAKPSTTNPGIRTLQPGATGWIQESTITKVALSTTPNQQNSCAANSPQS